MIRPWFALGSSMAQVFGMDVFGGKYSHIAKPIYRVIKPVVYDFKWWFLHRYWPSHRYNIVRTGLPPVYWDFDTRMLHACFSLLCDYVECHGGLLELTRWGNELLAGCDPNGPSTAEQGKKEIEAAHLYRWWKTDRPALKQEIKDLSKKLYGNDGLIKMRFEPINDGSQMSRVEFDKRGNAELLQQKFSLLEKRLWDEDKAMLHRLMDIREGLWT